MILVAVYEISYFVN